MLKYKCLVLDHDDTVMDSTAHVHHPAYLLAMDELRPGTTMTLDGYFKMNFFTGIYEYFKNELHFTDADFQRETEIWQSYVDTHIPSVFSGVDRIIKRQVEEGGCVCVCSYSFKHNILRDYRANGLPEPALVFGWELPREQRKPAVWSLEQIMEQLELSPADLLVVDDQKQGFDMANAAGVDFAAACWAYHVPEIRGFMHANSKLCFDEPAELERFLFT